MSSQKKHIHFRKRSKGRWNREDPEETSYKVSGISVAIKKSLEQLRSKLKCRWSRGDPKETSYKVKRKKTAEGCIILSKSQVGRSVAKSVAIYQKWLFQYRNIVGEKAFGASKLANGTQLDTIVMPQAPQGNTAITNAQFQADLKYAREN